jgi:hypothetical protein
MAKISLIFEDVTSDAQLETFVNTLGNITLAVYCSPSREEEYSGLIALDVNTAKAFVKHLNKVIKAAQNEQL